MNTEKKYNQFFKTSLPAFSFFIVTVYFLFNSILELEWLNMQGTLSAFSSVIFTVDCFTWHIYGVIAIAGFILRLVSINKNSDKRTVIYTILHFVFMALSFFEIFHMMQNAF